MIISENADLRPFNTFGIAAKAKYFATVTSESDIRELIGTDIYRKHRVLILGGGSNLLLTKDFDGLVIRNSIKGIRVTGESGNQVLVDVAAGEGWHDFVMYAVGHEWGGIENLSLIPGTMGAAPMQNIGAYGVEVRDVIVRVDAIDRTDGSSRSFTNDECQFGYRESIFKHTLREKFFISSVTLSLTNKQHRLNTTYGAIADTLKSMNVVHPTIRNISDAVIAIRQSKLPDPKKIGNAGSFFKNPTISGERYRELKEAYPSIPGYPSENQDIKVPAGWLIEQCGWKGKRFGDVGVHQHQALVLVNYGDGSGDEILQLSNNIVASVHEKFGIQLHAEVNII